MFNRREGFLELPVTVACGQCVGCRLERSRQWAVRIMHEASMHERNCFVTLTYDDENIPYGGSLDLADWQKFAKRLRKKIGKFRYFHCGEYGDESERPHYHAAIFGADFMFDRSMLKISNGYPLYSSPTLEEAWGKGYCPIGELTFESAAYVARYIMKKRNGPAAKEHYETMDPETGEVIDRKPEYITMSLKPGIGASWLEKFEDDVYPRDEVISNGRKTRPPSFYDRELEKRKPDVLEGLKSRRRVQASKHDENNTPDRLAVREKIQELKAKELKRTY